MTEGQSYQGPNDYRNDFYKKVTQLADEVSFRVYPLFGEDDSFQKFTDGSQQREDTKEPQPAFHPYISKVGDAIENAGKRLAQFVDPHNLLDRPAGQPRRPLVIISFDEAQILADNPPRSDAPMNWNMFSELRRVLRQTSSCAIFSLFLSTAGRFNTFSPEIHSDPSGRIRNSCLKTLDPITEISFDDLAHDAPEYKISLDKVVDFKWMCHLGRPL